MNTKITKILFLVVAFVMAFAINSHAAVADTVYYNATDYQNANSDLKKVYNGNTTLLAQHWNAIGKAEGRSPSKYYVPDEYLELNKDLKKVYVSNGKVDYVNLYNHFVACGIKEGRAGSKAFDPSAYIANNSDLKKAYVGADGKINYEAAYTHFALIGEKEGRASTAVAEEKHTHKTIKVEAVAPTCTTEGNIEFYRCEECDKFFTDEKATKEVAIEDTMIEATGHDLEKTAAVDATCTEAGNIEYYTCKNCDKLFSDAAATQEITAEDTVVAAAHKYEPFYTVEPTCTVEGTYYNKCSVCGELEKDENDVAIEYTAEKIDHTWLQEDGKDKVYSVNATCTTEGYERKYCTTCKQLITLSTTEPTGHDYSVEFTWAPFTVDETNLATLPTATAVYVCGNDDTDTNSATPAAATVTLNSGYTMSDCENSVNGSYTYTASYTVGGVEFTEEKTYTVEAAHNYGAATYTKLDNGDVNSTEVCTVCGYENVTLIHAVSAYGVGNAPTAYANKKLNRTLSDATCSEAGEVEYLCKNCNKTYTEDVATIPHTLTAEAAKAASCTEAGNIAYWHCSECDKYFSDAGATVEITKAETVIAALDHTLNKTAAKPANCATGKAGNIDYWTCATCGKLFADENAATEIKLVDTVIPADHTIEKVNLKDATCTEKGVKAVYYTCTVCDKNFTTKTATAEIAAGTLNTNYLSNKVAHKLVATAAVPATCTEAGKKAYYTCQTCNDIYKAKEGTEPASADSFVDAETDAPIVATLTKVEDEETQLTIAAGAGNHNFTHVTAQAPTCKVDGWKEFYYCDACDNAFTTNNNPTNADILGNAASIPAVKLVDGVKVDKLGHDVVVVTPRNCTEGAKVYCSRCDLDATETLGIGTEVTAEAPVEITAAPAGNADEIIADPATYADYLPTGHTLATTVVEEDGVPYTVTACTVCGTETVRYAYELDSATVEVVRVAGEEDVVTVTAYDLKSKAAAGITANSITTTLTPTAAIKVGTNNTYVVSVDYLGHTYTKEVEGTIYEYALTAATVPTGAPTTVTAWTLTSTSGTAADGLTVTAKTISNATPGVEVTTEAVEDGNNVGKYVAKVTYLGHTYELDNITTAG